MAENYRQQVLATSIRNAIERVRPEDGGGEDWDADVLAALSAVYAARGMRAASVQQGPVLTTPEYGRGGLPCETKHRP